MHSGVSSFPAGQVYEAAISSRHEEYGNRPGHETMAPGARVSSPHWELPLVLEALVSGPYKPLGHFSVGDVI